MKMLIIGVIIGLIFGVFLATTYMTIKKTDGSLVIYKDPDGYLQMYVEMNYNPEKIPEKNILKLNVKLSKK